MATVSQDALIDASPGSNSLLENHNSSIPGTAWAPLVAGAATHLFFTNDGQRLRGAGAGALGRYLAPGTPADGQVNIQYVLHAGSAVGTGNLGAIALAVGDGTDGTCYAIDWVQTSGGFQVNKVHADGSGTDAKLNNAIGSYAVSANTDQTVLVKVRNNAGHPQFIVLVNGVQKYSQTDSATAWSSSAKRVGIDLSGNATNADGAGLQAKGTWSVVDFVAIVASPTTLLTSTAGQVVNLTGMDTTFSAATFTLSGAAAAGSSITAHSASSDTAASLTLTIGSTPGTLTISDGTHSVNLTVQSSAPAATGLSFTSGPASGLTGQPSTDFVITGAPAGSVPAANTEVTLGDNSAGGTWSPAVVLLGPNVPAARATYTAPANALGVTRTTRTLSATATAGVTALTAGSTQYVAITPATTYTVSVPAAFTAGVASAPITVALPAGLGVSGQVAVFLSDNGAGGTFTPEAGTLTTDGASFQATYTAPHGATSVTISTTNNGSLANPGGQAVPVSAASNYSMDAPKVGPAGRTSTPITLTLTDPDVTGTVLLTLSDVSAQGTWSGANLLTGNTVALTQGEPTQTVYYTPANDLLAVGDPPAPVTFSVSNDRGLVDPPDVIYTVYDPVNYGEVAFLALYSQFAASGQAATIGITVRGKGKTVPVPHTTQYTEELGNTGDYVFVVPVPLLQSGAGSADPPAGQTQGYSQAYSAQGVSPIMAPGDRANAQADLQTTLTTVGLIGPDITSLEEAMATPDGRARFVFYMLTNASQDAAGNVIVRNLAGQVIANLADHQINTLLQTMVGGVFTVMPSTS